MDHVRFLVESSVGELEVELFVDGWVAIDISSDGPGARAAENIIRNSDELARAFASLGVPEPEATEAASELWGQLDADEREARARLRG